MTINTKNPLIRNARFPLFKDGLRRCTELVEVGISKNCIICNIAYFIVLISSNLYALPETVQISGTVYDKISGYPIVGAKVDIIEQDHHCITSTSGDFQFLILDEGEFTLKISALGFIDYSTVIDLKDSTNFRIYLVPSNIISGEVIITDNRINEETLNKKLSGKDLLINQKGTIAETMQSMTGINMRSMGAATSRPVINGMSNNRVKILENEFETGDLSATSNDHSLAVSSAGLSSIEIIDGSDILEYSAFASTPIIKMSSIANYKQIPEKTLAESGWLYETSNLANNYYLKLCQPIDNFILSGNYSNYNSSDMSSPNKSLNNTSSFVENFGGGIKFIKNQFSGLFTINNYINNYGIPGGFIGAHPNGVNIDLSKLTSNLSFAYNFETSFIKSINTDFSLINYHHTEYEGKDLLGAEFVQNSYSAKIDFNKDDNSNYGRFGLFYNFKDYKVGGYVFTPYVKSNNFAVYYINQIDTKISDIRFALRAETVDLEPYKFADTNYQKSRNFAEISGNLDFINQINESISLVNSIGRFFRTPSIEELYSRGPHLAAYTYEVGNPNLDTEIGYNFSTAIKIKNDLIELTFKPYFNYFERMILFRNSGDTNWAQFLPIYKSQNIEAQTYGFQFDYKVIFSKVISFGGNFYGTIGDNISDNESLPEIPPFSGNFHINMNTKHFDMILSSKFALNQYKLDKFETYTPGYNIFSISLNKSFLYADLLHSINISIDNIFDTEYFNHLSRIKSIMSEQGRNVRINYKIYY